MASLDLLTLARIAQDTYAPSNSTDLAGEWVLQDMLEDDNFQVRAYKPTSGKVAVIAFRGSANWQDWVVADAGAIGMSLNALALKLNSAIDFTGRMKGLYPNSWLVGHSLGGAYVQLLAAICELPGTTFNAPGVLGLLNQMSSNPIVKLAGAVGGGIWSVATLGVSDYFNKAAAALEDAAFQSVLNYRGNMDPVSRIGAHVGAPLQTIQLDTSWPNPHSMQLIVNTLQRRATRT